ncbi:MAG: hypothetical protein OIF35_03055 [Cellvibrionaceae bacterium]|nr:hypothetical protein [Cellvibrionaceae bacterium]MCV6625837.1 hypothetical protein [Cellvibrionaceae bacterium]
MWRLLLLLGLSLLLGACDGAGSGHFCAKYQFYYDKLHEPGVLPFATLKAQLRADLSDERSREDAKIALFVIADIERRRKRSAETAREYCMRVERWQDYP